MKKMCPSSNRHIAWFIPFQTDMFVRGDTSWVIYTPVFPIFNNNKKQFSSLHHYHFFFVRLFCKLSSSGSSDLYHFGETRSVLSWETIVHYPQYKLRGQIRLKDTTLSLGSDLLSNYCLYCWFVSFIFFWFLFFERTRELQDCLPNWDLQLSKPKLLKILNYESFKLLFLWKWSIIPHWVGNSSFYKQGRPSFSHFLMWDSKYI